MRKPTNAELGSARAHFRELLSRATPEPTWQAFFSANPFVISRALPLRLEPCDILPLGRPGRSEPDFLIYPGSNASIPTHGLVELKTNTARMTSVVRKNVLSLTRDAATAVNQLRVYDKDYDLFSPVKRCVSLSSASHLFVIMGLQQEITDLTGQPDLVRQLTELVPSNVRFLAFDELLAAYESGLSSRAFILVPDISLRKEIEATEADDGYPVTSLAGTFYRATIDGRPFDIRATFANLGRFGSRFGVDFGVFYAMDSIAACGRELEYRFAVLSGPRDARFRESIRRSGARLAVHEVEIVSTVHDLRSLDRRTSAYLLPDIVPASQVLGSRLRERGSNGLIYPSPYGDGFQIAMFTAEGIKYRGVSTQDL
jgi:hypothetical protein